MTRSAESLVAFARRSPRINREIRLPVERAGLAVRGPCFFCCALRRAGCKTSQTRLSCIAVLTVNECCI